MKYTVVISVLLLLGHLQFGIQALPAYGSAETYVYICTGPKATKYHRTDKCRGLEKCSKNVIKVTQAYAEEMGRSKCKICYKS